MVDLSKHKWLKLPVAVLAIGLFSNAAAAGQEAADLAVRARVNLYEKWDFDSVGWYLDRVIGEEYAPAFAYSDYGWYLMLADRFGEGLQYIERAAEMAPEDVQLAAWNAWALLWAKDLPSAKAWVEKALAIDPHDAESWQVASRIASASGEHPEAIRFAGRAAARNPDWRATVPLALARAGQREQALAEVKKILPGETLWDTMILAEVYAYLGDREKALSCLEKACELRHPFMPWLEFVPAFRLLKGDTRFRQIVRKMHLPK